MALEIDFELVNESALPMDLDEDDLRRVARSVLAAEGATGTWHITVALVDGERLQALHRDFMGVNEPTDIMTFPFDEEGGTAQGGDLVISVDHARNEADEWGMTPVEEVRFLVAHGLLHLLGWSDESEEQRRTMLDRQRALLDALARQV